MIPSALTLERGSEANAPLVRAILEGLLAGEPATLFVVPCLYAWMIRDKPGQQKNGEHPHPPLEHLRPEEDESHDDGSGTQER
jgi:hypothetical protein